MEPKTTIDLPFSPEDVRLGRVKSAWKCAGCGVEAVDDLKPCDCITGVGFRVVPGVGVQHISFRPVREYARVQADLFDRVRDITDQIPMSVTHAEAVKIDTVLRNCIADGSFLRTCADLSRLQTAMETGREDTDR